MLLEENTVFFFMSECESAIAALWTDGLYIHTYIYRCILMYNVCVYIHVICTYMHIVLD